MLEKASRYWLALLNLEGHPLDEHVAQICKDIRERWCREHPGNTIEFSYCVRKYCGHYPLYDKNGDFVRHLKAETPEQKKLVPADLYHIHIALYNEKPCRSSFITKVLGYNLYLTPSHRNDLNDCMRKTDDSPSDYNLPHEEVIFVC